MKFLSPQWCSTAHRWRRYCSFRQPKRIPPLCTMDGQQKIPVRQPKKNDGSLSLARLNSLELPTTVRSMEEHKDGSRPVTLCRTAQRMCAVLVVCLGLHTVDADAAGPRRNFQLEAGDASLMLNEFSRQSDLQVLFDFNILRGMKTHAVSGDMESSTALKAMLKGTNLTFDFVNDRTLAVTPKQPSLLTRLWHGLKSRPEHISDADDLEQVLISGAAESGTQPLLGAETLQLGRVDIDRSGLATTQDFLRTLPQVFGGGPSQDTTLGREANSNSAR